MDTDLPNTAYTLSEQCNLRRAPVRPHWQHRDDVGRSFISANRSGARISVKSAYTLLDTVWAKGEVYIQRASPLEVGSFLKGRITDQSMPEFQNKILPRVRYAELAEYHLVTKNCKFRTQLHRRSIGEFGRMSSKARDRNNPFDRCTRRQASRTLFIFIQY